MNRLSPIGSVGPDDLNGDLYLDLAVSDQQGSTISVLTNDCPPCPADINGNGFVDVVDLLALLSAWGPCAGCPEDVNCDGMVDVVDLLEVLLAWVPWP